MIRVFFRIYQPVFIAAALLFITAACSITFRNNGKKETEEYPVVTGDVTFTINRTEPATPISPYIYGSNFHSLSFNNVPFRVARLGGNRWTAYNWENNASNAGSDWYYHNDGYLGGGNTPGAAVINRVSEIFGFGSAALITVPIQGYVSADKNGDDVHTTPNHLETRFHENIAFKGSPLNLSPDTEDGYVYQDEFVNFIKNEFSSESLPIFYCLDNEPGLWSSTHEEVQPEHPSYDDVLNRNIEYARAVKSVDENAVTLGFVSYGFSGFVSLQDNDSVDDYETKGDFVSYFLEGAAEAEANHGTRIIDVLDFHWYSEARNDDRSHRVTEDGIYTRDFIEARIQSPRTLWQEGYTENSWIGDWGAEKIPLLPWFKEQVNAHYPGTKLSISEYYFGGADHISGAIAQADVLGILGREGIFLATIWGNANAANQDFIEGAFNMYLDYDGSGSAFGDESIPAESSDYAAASIYASTDSDDPDRLVLVAINKLSGENTAAIQISADGNGFTAARVYQLKADSYGNLLRGQLSDISIVNNSFIYTMPGYSVSTIEVMR